MHITALTLRRTLAACALLTLVATGCGIEKIDQGKEDAPAAQPTSGDPCAYPASSSPAKEVDAPPATPDLPDTLSAVMKTTIGDLELTLDAASAPCTVNSFVSLADQGYFDDTTCHRLTTDGILVLQCGDPSATGSGGPGYSFADELSGSETYPTGTLAMANAGPDTNGSQFFFVYGETPLPPSYTVFGTFSEKSVEAIATAAEKGTAQGGSDGAPKTEVRIAGVQIG